MRDGLPVLGLELDERTLAGLEGHLRLLRTWTEAINLTAIREPAAIATGHLLDALAAVPLLRARGVDAFVDLGSGGGVPGLPVAIGLPASRALLVDSIGKKVRFLATAIEALVAADLLEPDRVEAVAARAETLAVDRRHRGRWPAVLARAVAPLAELAELAFPLLVEGGVLVAWKRRTSLDEELAALEAALPALGGGRIDVIDAHVPGEPDHVLVIVERRGPVAARFPRPPAEREREPLGRGAGRQPPESSRA